MKTTLKNMDDLNLKEIWEIIKKRKWLLMASIFTVTLVTVIYSFMVTPIYEAKSRVLVNLEKPVPVNLSNNLPDDFKGKEFFETQLALIKSRSLIRDVIKQLNLNKSPEFQSDDFPFISRLSSWFKTLPRKLGFKNTSSEPIKPDSHSLLIDKIMKRLEVSQVRSSRILEISFQGKSPPLVAKVTNAVTRQYMIKTMELYNTSEGNIAGWLDNKLKDLNSKLKVSEDKLRQFKQKKGFIENKDGRNLVSKKWSEISQELTKAYSARLRLETQIQELKALKDNPLKLLLSQPFIFNENLSGLQKNYIALNNELNSLLRSKTPQHPDVILLTKKLNSINQKIPSEVDNFLSSLNIKFKAAVNQEKSLEKVLEEQQKTIMKSDNDFLQFKFLMQEVELNEKLYNEISNRKKKLEVTSNFNSSNISIVDSAEIPYLPIKPKKGLNIVLAILSSTFVGLLLIFFRESQDKTLKMDADFDDHLPYYYFGSIAKTLKKNLPTPFADLEEFRSLKAQFLLKTKDSSSKIFLITSPKPEEGKTFITTNLAISLGNSGKKVLVVDGDFYNSKITSIFNCGNKLGYLDGLQDYNRIFHETNFKNVWVTPSGGKAQNTSKTSDIFFSKSFRSFLEGAEAKWDYILIKAPPVLATPDAKILQNYCHSVLLVIQSGAHDPLSIQKIFNQLVSEKPKQRVDDIFPSLASKPNKLMGVVINKVDRKYKKIEYSYYQKLGER